MNWNSPAMKQSLQDLRETLALQGRDSRVVRGAYAYSRYKKRALSGFRQFLYGLGGKRPKNSRRLRVLFYLAGGMGDASCARRLVEAYKTFLPEADVEVYSPVPLAVQTVFGDLSYITAVPSGRIYWRNYDLAVFACLPVKFLYADEARLSLLAPSFIPVFERAKAAQNALGILLDDPFLTEPALGRWLLKNGGRRFDLMSYTGGTELPHDAVTHRAVSKKSFGLGSTPYITFHDSKTQNCSQLPTRFWPTPHWRKWIGLFKEKFPDIKVVQLGGKDSPVYAEADVCLVGKTELTDLPALLNNALCHVDTESGLVHLAQFLDVRSAVLFGPSDVRFFGYAKNKNLSAGNCGGCMWMTSDWMTRCPLRRAQPGCVAEISPQQVLSAVEEILSGR